MRSEEIIAINDKLEIVKENAIFRMGKKDGYYSVRGFTLRHLKLGYISFNSETPYNPGGGKSILNAGGFVSFEGMSWVKEI